MGAYGHPLSLTKHAFFVLCMYRGHPNIWGIQTYGASKDMGMSKHTGGYPNMKGIQTYGGIQHMGSSKCMGAYGHPISLTKHAFFVLCMYRGHPNIWGHTIFCIILNYMCHLEFLPSCFVFFLNFKYFKPFFKIFYLRVLHYENAVLLNCGKLS